MAGLYSGGEGGAARWSVAAAVMSPTTVVPATPTTARTASTSSTVRDDLDHVPILEVAATAFSSGVADCARGCSGPRVS